MLLYNWHKKCTWHFIILHSYCTPIIAFDTQPSFSYLIFESHSKKIALNASEKKKNLLAGTELINRRQEKGGATHVHM